MSLFAIGDIHGCNTALDTLFKSVPIRESDQIVFLGDYIDRGPGSRQVIDFIIEKSRTHKITALRGNHEVMMMEARIYQSSLTNWLRNGGVQTLDSYTIGDDFLWYSKIPEAHWHFVQNTLEYFEYNDFIFVHAGLAPGIELKNQVHDILFWKHQYNPLPYKENKIVVCGHTPQKNGEIKNLGHTIFVDTWAFNGQWLTCVNLETGYYWQSNESAQTRSGKIDVNFKF